ncbi:MAG: aminopeptidase N [Gammaproteobacteria bacterium]
MRDANPRTTYLKDYRPPDYRIDWVDLRFELSPGATLVQTRMKLRKNSPSVQGYAPLRLDGEDLELVEVHLDGKTLGEKDYEITPDALLIPGVPQGRYFLLEIATRINPEANTNLEGLFLSNGMFCTQCEAQGFRRITYFLDRPDVMTVFTTTLVADREEYPVLLANGNRVESGDLDQSRHFVKWKDPFKKPAYLFALVAGRLECLTDTYQTESGRRIDLAIYVEPHDRDKCAHAMLSLKKAMRWDEEVYGREYDLDLYMIVAVGHFNMGAMENKGLNIFNAKYVLARPDTATDTDYEQIEAVIGHEYFHNWTGNRVTLRDWFQLSLKEGFTVFRDQEFTADQTSRGVKRITDVNRLRTFQFAEDAGPLAHPVRPESYIEINNFYTLTVYEKGAEVVRMLHTLLGAQGFRKGTDLYFQRHDGQAVTTDEFVAAMEDANGIDLSQFRLWYRQAGTPEIRVTSEYDSRKRILILEIGQKCPATPDQAEKKPFHIPIRLALLGARGKPLAMRLEGGTESSEEMVIQLRERQQTFCFENVPEKPAISIARGFSAPVKVSIRRTPEELQFLLAYDSDPFCRWEAGQALAGSILLDAVRSIQDGTMPGMSSGALIDAFRTLLCSEWADLSFQALLLHIPSEKYLAEQMDVIDVDAIHAATRRIKRAIASELQDLFLDLYRRNHNQETGGFDRDAIGRRRLKAICLEYLLELDSEEAHRLCMEQYSGARTMTDQIAALNGILNSTCPAKTEFVEAFYRQWEKEALVIDKWFTLQAMSPVAGVLPRILELKDHTAFDIRNPNRVRALAGAFSQSNPVCFHARDGGGYAFLATIVSDLNAINPQLASRMVGAFTQWRRFDPHRQHLMKDSLQGIIATEDLSRDVYEIVRKTLDN